MSGTYISTKTSLLKICNDIRQAFLSQDFGNVDFNPDDFDTTEVFLEVFDFDKHATVEELPASDLIGIGEFSLKDDEGTNTASCSMVVCTMADDDDLRRMMPVTDYIYTLLKAGVNFDLLMPDATKVGELVVMSPTIVLPIGLNRTRPFQEILVNFGVLRDQPE